MPLRRMPPSSPLMTLRTKPASPLAQLLRRDALRAIHRRRRDDLEDILGIDLAVADADEELVQVADAQRLEDLAELGLVLEQLRERHAALLEFALEELASELERLVALLLAQEIPDLGARPRG